MRDSKRSHGPLGLTILGIAILSLLGCSSKSTTESPAPPSSAASATPKAAPTESSAEKPPLGPSLVAISAGAYIVKRPSEWMDSESAYAMLDENPRSKWATSRGVVSPQTIVIALPEKTLLKTLEFDNASIDSQFTGCSAKDITVEVSDASANDGFQQIAEVSLQDRMDDQRFPVSREMPGRWVRLTVKNNHSSDPDNTIELNEFRGYGTQLTQTAPPDLSGTYAFDFTGGLHLKQEGTSLTGCYENRRGLIKGGVEGHIAKFTWYEQNGYDPSREMGSAVMVLPADGQPAVGVWWETGYQENAERVLLGPKKSSEIGSCPHWLGGVEAQLVKDLEDSGRTRVYGINFDTDSDKIKDESKPTLDKIVSVLKAKPQWKLTIEGHTDSTSTAEHNQALSERRAASVKAYLQAAGIDAARLQTVGFGATRPVASNDNELGRAQNRRVELVKQ